LFSTVAIIICCSMTFELLFHDLCACCQYCNDTLLKWCS
jgi:hypothetical protein